MKSPDLRPLAPEGRLILKADASLTSHLRILVGSGRFRRKKLISGFLGKTLLDAKEAQGCSPHAIWRAFPEASFCRKQLYKRRFQLPRGDFLDQFSDYLLERFDGKHTKVSDVFRSAESGTLDSWNELVYDYSDRQIEIEIQRLCDWIEADAAFIVFANYKRHRPTMACDPSKAFGATVGLYLKNASKEEGGERLRFEKEWGRKILYCPNIENNPTFIRALSYAGSAGPPACSAFDRLLFCIWPIVLHGRWNSIELETFLIPGKLDTPHEFSNDSHGYLSNRGLGFARIHGYNGNGRESRQPTQLPGWKAARALIKARHSTVAPDSEKSEK